MTIPNINLQREQITFSLNEFKKTGLVPLQYKTLPDFKKDKKLYIDLENIIFNKNISCYFQEFQTIESFKNTDYVIDILKTTNNGTKNVRDITHLFKHTFNTYLGFDEMILPVKVLNITWIDRTNKGVTYSQNHLRNEILITIHETNSYSNFSFEKAITPAFTEFSKTKHMPRLGISISEGIPQYTKDIDELKDNLAYNLFVALNLDKTTTLIHEGIHALYYLNHVTPEDNLRNVVMETGALIFGRNIQIDKSLSKINEQMDIYSEHKLKEIKKNLYLINTKITKHNLLHCKAYNPALQKEKVAALNFDQGQVRKLEKQYIQNVEVYTNAMNHLIEELSDKSRPLIDGLHEAIRLPFDDFIKLFR